MTGILFVALSIPLLMLIPYQVEAILEAGNYSIEGDGFLISPESIINSKISINFHIDSKYNLEFESGSLFFDSDEFQILRNVQSRFLKEGQLVRFSGSLENGDRFSLFGRTIGENNQGIVMELRGVITQDDKNTKSVFSSKITKSEKIIPQKEVPIEKEEGEKKVAKSDLVMLIRHDSRTYWKDVFQITTKVFDKKLNPNPQFHESLGSIDGVDISVTMTHERTKLVKTLEGKTHSNGYFQGRQYIKDNVDPGGKYLVEVVASYLGNSITENLITYVIADVPSGGVGNKPPVANAGPDQMVAFPGIATLDGSGSFDPESGPLTYLWVQTSGPPVALIPNDMAVMPTFGIPLGPTTLTFQLTVTDDVGKQDSDSVTITVS